MDGWGREREGSHHELMNVTVLLLLLLQGSRAFQHVYIYIFYADASARLVLLKLIRSVGKKQRVMFGTMKCATSFDVTLCFFIHRVVLKWQ